MYVYKIVMVKKIFRSLKNDAKELEWSKYKLHYYPRFNRPGLEVYHRHAECVEGATSRSVRLWDTLLGLRGGPFSGPARPRRG